MPTAMEIYKLLPKKNCGECKFPTCLAFAMQLANLKVALTNCTGLVQQVLDVANFQRLFAIS